MAARPNRPCLKRNCRAITRNANGYCDQHQADAAAWVSSDRKGSATERGYGWHWRKLRDQVLKRDRYVCRCDECKASGRVLAATEVDHRIPKAQGGTDDSSNLCAINSDCHKRKTQAEAAAGRRRRRAVASA